MGWKHIKTLKEPTLLDRIKEYVGNSTKEDIIVNKNTNQGKHNKCNTCTQIMAHGSHKAKMNIPSTKNEAELHPANALIIPIYPDCKVIISCQITMIVTINNNKLISLVIF